MSYKKKEHWYIVRQSEHNHTNETNTLDVAHHQPQPLGREDRNRPLTPALSSPMLCHTKVVTRCKPE
jgi:hypothetical protein